MRDIIDTLYKEQNLNKEQLIKLISQYKNTEVSDYITRRAQEQQQQYYGNKVFIRGLLEISNYCKNDCFYCGIRYSNKEIERYNLSETEILECCNEGYKLGFRSFVLQGGENFYFNDECIVKLTSTIKQRYPNCALTLSLGEKTFESYAAYRAAGADRYLLRHETANPIHYKKLHPKDMSLDNRKRCLNDLKKLGYQTGTGFMVGAPYQTFENIAEDLLFIKELQPEMVGIGPFIPHHKTPFANFEGGTIQLTLFLLSMIRLLLPKTLLPSTTALGTIDASGRVNGILAGANVIMPNLSPQSVRQKYMIYDNKTTKGTETAEYLDALKEEMRNINYEIVEDKGDALL